MYKCKKCGNNLFNIKVEEYEMEPDYGGIDIDELRYSEIEYTYSECGESSYEIDYIAEWEDDEDDKDNG